MDHACYLWRMTGKREVLDKLQKRFPASKLAAALHFESFLRNAPDQPNARRTFARVLEACRVPGDTPAYVPAWSTWDAPAAGKNFKYETAAYGRRLVRWLRTEKKYEEAIAVLKQVLQLHRGPKSAYMQKGERERLLRDGRIAYNKLGRMDDWMRVLEHHIAGIELESVRRDWQRDLLSLKQECSYLRDWAVFGPVHSGAHDSAGASPTWREIHNDFDHHYVDLRTLFPPAPGEEKPAAAVCSLVVDAAAAGKGLLLLGFDEEIEVTFNDKVVYRDRGIIAVPDEHAIPVSWKKGPNALVIRLKNRRLAWGFYARLADSRGKYVPGLTVRSRRIPAPVTPPRCPPCFYLGNYRPQPTKIRAGSYSMTRRRKAACSEAIPDDSAIPQPDGIHVVGLPVWPGMPSGRIVFPGFVICIVTVCMRMIAVA
jgi:hypothetical protein